MKNNKESLKMPSGALAFTSTHENWYLFIKKKKNVQLIMYFHLYHAPDFIQ